MDKLSSQSFYKIRLSKMKAFVKQFFEKFINSKNRFTTDLGFYIIMSKHTVNGVNYMFI
jgi:hypothetical protein